MKEDTQLVTVGRHPERFGGLVNTPICRASTILAGSMAEWEEMKRARAAEEPGATTYGRYGTATTHAFEEAIAALEGGHRSLAFPSGLAAIVTTLTALLSAGDHVLVTYSAYSPTRSFLDHVLSRLGVEVEVYDPGCGKNIESVMRSNTRVVYVESPGSETLEIQDIPAITAVAHAHGAFVVMDNTWATPLFFKPFEHGVDVSIHAATKYIVGHSDAMLGVVTCNEATWAQVKKTTQYMGQTAGPDDIYLALRGLRTMGVRLQRHWASGLRVAQWLEQQAEVEAVVHPALPSHPGHALWKRDFRGASGLFTVVLRASEDESVAAFVDALQHFGIGVSWGGYESLAIPFTPGKHHGARWPYTGKAVRLHVGLEDPEDLIADLNRGLAALAARKSLLQAAEPTAA
ncbi:Cystathionine beta-lyase MetC [Achromobacter insolitus]|uniref:cystathionine beta-lyase n=1 Tax=Achromobacter insolitus TaxID=217204 RepID=UPI0007C2914C|nr:cystathionine beta-lyase [Achromobacter insolitus]AXA71842.1 cystathionine beta-lyase [Achromobacter insolitus]MDQ6211801.1 cystathionine beta-lyase [Achromobacter insolitus]OAD12632.1 cystathionine beta-lyase [Achromobacter insolitus]QEK91278.1 cystathionine beta-lyase [Achromobacter insolitus]CAB3954269.1 Cystathionine beta-lyase MetC [Achromobacter insolitus]